MRLFAERGTTRLTVQELARAAGVARGTVYSHVPSAEGLFEQVAADLTQEMNQRVLDRLASHDDPALRLCVGMRAFLGRSHEDPAWARFLVRFAMTERSLAGLWTGAPAHEIGAGVAAGRFRVRPAQVPSMVALVAGSLLAAMLLVVEGHQTWRAATAYVGQLVLRGLGLEDADIEEVLAACTELA